MKTITFFGDEDCPIVVHEKNGKQALYDQKEKKYIVGFTKNRYDLADIHNPGEWCHSSDGKYFIASSHDIDVLFIDYKPELILKDGTKISWFTMKPNSEFVVLQKGKEWIYSLEQNKKVTPEYSSIYPFFDFPKSGLYKARIDRQEAVYQYPENNRITPLSDDVMSIGNGAFGNLGPFYYTTISNRRYYWIKWNRPVLHDYPEEAERIFGRLDEKITIRQAIKKCFK